MSNRGFAHIQQRLKTLSPAYFEALAILEQTRDGNGSKFAEHLLDDPKGPVSDFLHQQKMCLVYGLTILAFSFIYEEKIGPDKAKRLRVLGEQLSEPQGVFAFSRDFSLHSIRINPNGLHYLNAVAADLMQKLKIHGEIYFPDGFSGYLDQNLDTLDHGHASLVRLHSDEYGNYYLTRYNTGDEHVPYAPFSYRRDFNKRGLDLAKASYTQRVLSTDKHDIQKLIVDFIIKTHSNATRVGVDGKKIEPCPDYNTHRQNIENRLSSIIRFRVEPIQTFGNCTTRSIREALRDTCDEIGHPEISDAIRDFITGGLRKKREPHPTDIKYRLLEKMRALNPNKASERVFDAIREETKDLIPDALLNDGDRLKIKRDKYSVVIDTSIPVLKAAFKAVRKVNPDWVKIDETDMPKGKRYRIKYRHLSAALYHVRDHLAEKTLDMRAKKIDIRQQETANKRGVIGFLCAFPEIFKPRYQFTHNRSDFTIVSPHQIPEQPVYVMKAYHEMKNLGIIDVYNPLNDFHREARFPDRSRPWKGFRGLKYT